MQTKRTRRAFMQAAGVTAAGAIVTSERAEAQQQASEPREAAVRSLMAIVRARHGKQLSEVQLKNIQQAIGRAQANAELLKRTPLENGDEPAFRFDAEVS